MADASTYCQDTVDIFDAEGLDVVTLICDRLVVTAKGVKVEHIHHHRDLDVPGCEQARVSWTRRR